MLIIVAIIDALLGMSIGIFVSSFAKTEFQAVQFLPAILFPQLLLSGLLAPRAGMPSILRVISDFLPLTYAVDATDKVIAGHGALAHDFFLLAIFLICESALLLLQFVLSAVASQTRAGPSWWACSCGVAPAAAS